MEVRDAELVAAGLDGSPVAFGVLAARHRAAARRRAERILGDPHEAEDVTQEALLQAYLGLGTLRDPERFEAWLSAIAANLARMRVRARSDVPVPRVDREAEDGDLLEPVRAAIAALPPAELEAVVLFYVHGLSAEEAAAVLAVQPGTVRVRLHRARRKLQESLSDFAPATLRAREEPTMIEVTVDDVVSRFADEELVDEWMRVVLLREKEGERVLPIWIGAPEGDALVLRIAGEETQRPMTADLTLRLVQALGGAVERVAVSALREKTFFAVIAVRRPEGRVEVDARPSDAINLALRAGAPIYVDDGVFDQAALAGDDLAEKLASEEAMCTGQRAGGEWRPVSPEVVRRVWRLP